MPAEWDGRLPRRRDAECLLEASNAGAGQDSNESLACCVEGGSRGGCDEAREGRFRRRPSPRRSQRGHIASSGLLLIRWIRPLIRTRLAEAGDGGEPAGHRRAPEDRRCIPSAAGRRSSRRDDAAPPPDRELRRFQPGLRPVERGRDHPASPWRRDISGPAGIGLRGTGRAGFVHRRPAPSRSDLAHQPRKQAIRKFRPVVMPIQFRLA